MRAKCFSSEDRLLMAERVWKNETGIQNKEFKVRRNGVLTFRRGLLLWQWYQAREAFTDPIVLSCTLISVGYLSLQYAPSLHADVAVMLC